ncbi:putative serine/threonine-protein kinase [Trypanosoma vivax]|nr:putative serine/threonine-protein kinase [Trypanosoma vivax]
MTSKGLMDSSRVLFPVSEVNSNSNNGNNGGTDICSAHDGWRTPLSAQQPPSCWVTRKTPDTPIKKPRTRHERRGNRQITYVSSGSRKREAAPHCGGVTSRKRPSIELSQFSALRLDDTDAVAFASQERNGHREHAVVPQVPFTQHIYSQTSSPRAFGVVRRGIGHSFLPYAPESQEHSQADSEFSNFLNYRIQNDFREVRELGKGSFGRVALFEETSTGSLVAIKVSSSKTNLEHRRRLERERDILKMVRGFPHVVQLLDSWVEGHTPQVFLQLEYCPGGSVAERAEQRRQRGEAWSERELTVFLAHMALALNALHSVNIVHLDFKPDNVLIDDVGDYKLGDFGCSAVVGEDGRQKVNFIESNSQLVSTTDAWGKAGTAVSTMLFGGLTQLSAVSVEEGDCRYLCDDMINGKQHPKKGDMFSLGISLFELMSGEPLPNRGEAFLKLRQNSPVELLVGRGYSRRFAGLVASLMHGDPTERPESLHVLQFIQLPQHVPQLVSQWPTLGKEEGCEEKDKKFAEMSFAYATLEVYCRLVDVARRELNTRDTNSSRATMNTGTHGDEDGAAGGVVQRPCTDTDEFCTPKTTPSF